MVRVSRYACISEAHIGCRLSKGHSGQYLAEELVAALKEFKIEEKVCYSTAHPASDDELTWDMSLSQLHGVTVDNAENNTTMLKHISILIPGHRGTLLRVHCFDHVLNLVVKVCSVFRACIHSPQRLTGAEQAILMQFTRRQC